MEVVDCDPYAWFLLGDGDRLYLDARVARSAVEWTVVVELTAEERAAYATQGKPALDALAASIDLVPERYSARNLRATLGESITRTIVAWRQAGAPGRDIG